jgi:hypothetical protein
MERIQSVSRKWVAAIHIEADIRHSGWSTVPGPELIIHPEAVASPAFLSFALAI